MFGSFSAICTNSHIVDLLERASVTPMPLTRAADPIVGEIKSLTADSPESLFPGAQSPSGSLAGLFLRCGAWAEAHETCQDDSSREGSLWHAIVHRQEPDTGNASYWYRTAGSHPVFPQISTSAATILEQFPRIGWSSGAKWDPILFLRWCDEARREPGSQKQEAALRLQQLEWECLFRWCCAPR